VSPVRGGSAAASGGAVRHLRAPPETATPPPSDEVVAPAGMANRTFDLKPGIQIAAQLFPCSRRVSVDFSLVSCFHRLPPGKRCVVDQLSMASPVTLMAAARGVDGGLGVMVPRKSTEFPIRVRTDRYSRPPKRRRRASTLEQRGLMQSWPGERSTTPRAGQALDPLPTPGRDRRMHETCLPIRRVPPSHSASAVAPRWRPRHDPIGTPPASRHASGAADLRPSLHAVPAASHSKSPPPSRAPVVSRGASGGGRPICLCPARDRPNRGLYGD
jgi:hypothetical protein